MNLKQDIRYSIVSGSFYPGNIEVLKGQITEFLDKAQYKNLKNIRTLICPHAGYVYSGQVAAYSYRQIKDKKFDSIFIIAPSHSEYFDFNSVFDGKGYETPLGLVNIDEERCKRLVASGMPNIKFSKYGHRSEHSLEVQLPFLQTVLKEFKIVPIVMGNQSRLNIESLGKTIGDIFKEEEILIIASTDLSHYHPYEEAVSLDMEVEKFVKKFDIESLEKNFLNNKIEMCGAGPVLAAMIAAKAMGADSSEILYYQNSGDISGDKSAVVGYLSAAIFKK
jgi:MEMO1 family protein